jgi:hypothetical protein
VAVRARSHSPASLCCRHCPWRAVVCASYHADASLALAGRLLILKTTWRARPARKQWLLLSRWVMLRAGPRGALQAAEPGWKRPRVPPLPSVPDVSNGDCAGAR